jgi:plastocyanin
MTAMWPPLPRASAAVALRAALALILTLVLVACGQAASSSPVATVDVDLPQSYRFAPANIVVPAGSTVTWTNHDNFTHTVRLIDGDGEVLFMKPGERVTRGFADPGLYRYDCSLHPNDMQGTVLVEAATS